jgi:hypothetical protein
VSLLAGDRRCVRAVGRTRFGAIRRLGEPFEGEPAIASDRIDRSRNVAGDRAPLHDMRRDINDLAGAAGIPAPPAWGGWSPSLSPDGTSPGGWCRGSSACARIPLSPRSGGRVCEGEVVSVNHDHVAHSDRMESSAQPGPSRSPRYRTNPRRPFHQKKGRDSAD